MAKLYKQFEVWVTKSRAKLAGDKFLSARIKLTLFYSSTVALILGAASFLIYKVLMANLFETLRDDMINPLVANKILSKAQLLIQSRLITIDFIILFFVILLSFFLTEQTLKPIQKNASRQKRFIADAAHELRTPIAVVISGLEVALRNKNLNIEMARITLQSSLDVMKEFSLLSNTLLDVSKYDNETQADFKNINMKDLLISVTSKMQYLATSKNILIQRELTQERNIKGNEIELGRVFVNILNNAITHTPDGGSIIITDQNKNNEYVVSIKDTGPGIPKEMLEKIFEPFYRGDASRNTDGAGLGLTLSRKIIENHKGSIVIDSGIGKGTEVIIKLPFV